MRDQYNWLVVYGNIYGHLFKYLQDNPKLKSLVIGMSGGIDSTICAFIARKVCDEYSIPLIGRSLPIESKEAEVRRAFNAGSVLCTNFSETNLEDQYKIQLLGCQARQVEESDIAYKIRKGNIKARTRMVHLFDLAQAMSGMVLSTDNLSELKCGFWTLHGDVGNYGMIQNMWKSEEYLMARALVESDLTNKHEKEVIQEGIEAIPTDGLDITASDYEQLGVSSYNEGDDILSCWETGDHQYDNHPIVLQHLKTEFKRNDPYNIPRQILFRDSHL